MFKFKVKRLLHTNELNLLKSLTVFLLFGRTYIFGYNSESSLEAWYQIILSNSLAMYIFFAVDQLLAYDFVVLNKKYFFSYLGLTLLSLILNAIVSYFYFDSLFFILFSSSIHFYYILSNFYGRLLRFYKNYTFILYLELFMVLLSALIFYLYDFLGFLLLNLFFICYLLYKIILVVKDFEYCQSSWDFLLKLPSLNIANYSSTLVFNIIKISLKDHPQIFVTFSFFHQIFNSIFKVSISSQVKFYNEIDKMPVVHLRRKYILNELRLFLLFSIGLFVLFKLIVQLLGSLIAFNALIFISLFLFYGFNLIFGILDYQLITKNSKVFMRFSLGKILFLVSYFIVFKMLNMEPYILWIFPCLIAISFYQYGRIFSYRNYWFTWRWKN